MLVLRRQPLPHLWGSDAMTKRRRARKMCTVPAKPKPIWRDEEAARWGARIHYRNTIRAGWWPTLLHVYECPGTGHWHLTTRPGRPERAVPIPYQYDGEPEAPE